MGHTNLSNKKKPYWEFDWEEMGTKDTPKLIDFVLDKTGFEKISYIGHSEGCTQIFAGAALLPDYYKEKMLVGVMMAPPASMYHNTNKLFELLSLKANRVALEEALDLAHFWNIMPHDFITTGAGTIVCALFDGVFCKLILSLFCDADPSVDYMERMDVYMSFMPAGAGYRDTVHYGQLIRTDRPAFRRYDYETKKKNREHYGVDYPPDYDLSKLDFPIAMITGSEDEMADPKDAEWTTE